MVTEAPSRPLSDLAIHPGEYLAEELEARGLSLRAFALAIGQPTRVVSDIVRMKRGISADIAVSLERGLGISARTWMNLQSAYELTLAYQRQTARAAATG